MFIFKIWGFAPIVIFSPRRRLRLYEPEAIIPFGLPREWPQKAL
jgi:hypothetical protein